MTYDQWKTTEPDDCAHCESHGQRLPCRLCKEDYLEQVMDWYEERELERKWDADRQAKS